MGLSKHPASPTSATGRGCGNPEMHKVGCHLLVQWLHKAGIAVALSPMALSRLGCICAWVGRVSAGHGMGRSAGEVAAMSERLPPPSARQNTCFWKQRCPTASCTHLPRNHVYEIHGDHPYGGMVGVVPICCRWLLFSPVQPRTQSPAHSPAGSVAFPTRGRCRLPHFCTGAVLP